MGNLTTCSNLQKQRQLQIQMDQSPRTLPKGRETRGREMYLGKGAESVHARKEKGEPSLAPDLEALNRQGASLSRHSESLGSAWS